MELYLEPIRKNYNKNNGQFIKGSIPWNKGISFKCNNKKTQFKNGHIPYNTLHDKAITLRHNKSNNKDYFYIRLSLGKWQLLNRYNWEQKNGLISKGYIIRHKDGNHLNCNIDNLELINRAENLKRNINREKQSKTMKGTWKSERRRVKYGLIKETRLKIY